MDRQDTINFRRRRRRTASVEGVTTVDAVRHLRCRKVVGITIPRVRPSGITRGYAWCVPAGDSGCGLGGFPFFSLSTSPLLHGVILRASPAVTHGVSPPGTVGAGWEFSLFSPSPLLHFSTGSPFGHHPRLRMMCPRWGQWAISSPTKKNKLWGGVCFLIVAALFVALKNTIRAWADAIRMSADSLIVFSNAIRIFSMAHIAAVFASSRGF